MKSITRTANTNFQSITSSITHLDNLPQKNYRNSPFAREKKKAENERKESKVEVKEKDAKPHPLKTEDSNKITDFLFQKEKRRSRINKRNCRQR